MTTVGIKGLSDADVCMLPNQLPVSMHTRKPSCRWQTRATRKHVKNCSNSTCLLRCRWQYWPIFIRL